MPRAGNAVAVTPIGARSFAPLASFPKNLIDSQDEAVANFARRVNAAIDLNLALFEEMREAYEAAGKHPDFSPEKRLQNQAEVVRTFVASILSSTSVPVDTMKRTADEAEQSAYRTLPRPSSEFDLESVRRTAEMIKARGTSQEVQLAIKQRVASGDAAFTRDLFGTFTPRLHGDEALPPIQRRPAARLAVEQLGFDHGFADEVLDLALDAFGQTPYRRALAVRALIKSYGDFVNNIAIAAYKSGGFTEPAPVLVPLDEGRYRWPTATEVSDH